MCYFWCMDAKYLMTLLDKHTKDLVTYDIRTGEEVSRNGVLANNSQLIYSLETADAVANLVREGLSLTKAANQLKIPLHVLYRWKEMHPDFAARLKAAKAGRADYYRDRAADVIETVDLK